MKELFREYIINLYQDVPTDVYEGLVSVFFLAAVIFVVWKGFKTGLQYSVSLLLIEYIFLIFCSTVIFRATGETRQYDFHPFWSYSRPDLFVENLMNVIVFIPIGMILGSLLKVKGSWSKYGSWFKVNGSWLIVLLIGCSISVTIEALQFWFMKGFSEVDDVMHNTLGCVIGYIAYKSMSVVSKRLIILCKNCGNDFI